MSYPAFAAREYVDEEAGGITHIAPTVAQDPLNCCQIGGWSPQSLCVCVAEVNPSLREKATSCPDTMSSEIRFLSTPAKNYRPRDTPMPRNNAGYSSHHA